MKADLAFASRHQNLTTACRLQEKNVSTSMLDGKVGRIYMPRQDFESLALRKMKVRRLRSPRHRQTLFRAHVVMRSSINGRWAHGTT